MTNGCMKVIQNQGIRSSLQVSPSLFLQLIYCLLSLYLPFTYIYPLPTFTSQFAYIMLTFAFFSLSLVYSASLHYHLYLLLHDFHLPAYLLPSSSYSLLLPHHLMVKTYTVIQRQSSLSDFHACTSDIVSLFLFRRILTSTSGSVNNFP